ncbi:Ser-Thr-rich glycosyl-phosphatidyl-inositol-anchored membrane family-domain-containing protein [Aspergillus karnatakaensis]|uniref:GPI anchored serine-threonine rich family protein n=1 Tax=Aspergillus karnatakaensis TaxID=1810916 RepID=UPI003CCDB4FA
MRSVFFVALSAIATLVSARENPFNIPGGGYEFAAGEATTLTWDPTTEGTVTIKLQWGDVLTSSTGSTIVSSIPNSGSYTWSVPSSIVDRPDYTIEIISDSSSESNNYLPRFTVEGAEEAATTTTSSHSTTTTETTTTETETETETSTTSTRTTLTTTTTETPTPTPTSTSTSTETPSSTTTEESSSTSTETPTETPTEVPTVNDDGDNAGMAKRVSGGLLAFALGVAILV